MPKNKNIGGKKYQTGEVRIIAGNFGGRKLAVLSADGLRPTADRVRETVFNWLQFDVAGANCLDVFAGSGALGFEALSRGAKSVTMLELDKNNAKQLINNIQLLGAKNAETMQIDALQFIARDSDDTFDIVFIDPPFHQDLMQKTIDSLFTSNLLKDTSILYLEQEKSLALPSFPNGWHAYKDKTTSQVSYSLFKKVT